MSPRSPIKSPKPHTSLCRDILDLSFCVTGIYVCYIGFGIYQEKIFQEPRGPNGVRFHDSLFLTWCLAFVNMWTGLLGCLVTGAMPWRDATPKADYFKIGFSYVGAMFCSNEALVYVDYPTQALGKSVKIIPVMLMRTVLGGTKYELREYLTVLMITAGVSIFMLAKVKAKGDDFVDSTSYFIGVTLLLVSLILDGFTGPKQDTILEKVKPAPTLSQMMFWLNFSSIILVGVALVVTGTGLTAALFVWEYPQLIGEMLIVGLLGAFGQNFILHTVFRFNSLVLSIITTTRKFFTLLVSVFMFGHTLLPAQIFGTALVFGGLFIDMYFQYHAKKARVKLAEKAQS